MKLSGNKATRNHSVWEAYGFYNEALDTLNQLPETGEYKKEKLEVFNLVTVPIALLGYPKAPSGCSKKGSGSQKNSGITGVLDTFTAESAIIMHIRETSNYQ